MHGAILVQAARLDDEVKV